MKFGTIYRVKTFAGVVVHMKALRYYPGEGEDWCEGCLTRKEDVIALKEAGVPYTGNERPEECLGTMFKFQIVSRVNKTRRRRAKNK